MHFQLQLSLERPKCIGNTAIQFMKIKCLCWTIQVVPLATNCHIVS